MATFTITELIGAGLGQGGVGVPVPHFPPVTTQTAITTSGSSQQSAAFNAATSIVMVECDVAVRILVGSNPTANANSFRVPADEPFSFQVTPGSGLKVAVINA